jgi:hypothetical protein
MHTFDALRTELLRLKYHAAALAFEIKLRAYDRSLKANFNPDQPRVPAGHPDGGQWTRVAGSLTDISAARRRAGGLLRRIGDRLVKLTPEQQIRIDTYESQANAAITRVQELDPDWRPRSSLYDATAESAIRKAKDLVLEAEARLLQLGQQTPAGLIDLYRAQNNSRDLFGHETWPREKGTVGFSIFDGLPIFGMSSDAPPYRESDRISAVLLRDSLVHKYPDIMRTDNLGQNQTTLCFMQKRLF